MAETTGATIFLIRDQTLITPPVTAGILESITRKNVIEMARSKFGLEVIERAVDRTELYVADEIFITGTLCEVQSLVGVDDLAVADGKPGKLTIQIRDSYLESCEAGAASNANWLTPLSPT